MSAPSASSVATTKLQLLLTQWASGVFGSAQQQAEFKKSAMEHVAEGADLNVLGNGHSKSTLLHVLVTNNVKGENDKEIIQLLKSNKKLVHVEDGDKQTPLQALFSLIDTGLKPNDTVNTAMILARHGAVLTVTKGGYTTCPLLEYLLNDTSNNRDKEISELLTINKDLVNVLHKEGQKPLQILLNRHIQKGAKTSLVGADVHARIKKTAMIFVEQGASPGLTDTEHGYGTLLHYLFLYNKNGVNDKEIARLMQLQPSLICTPNEAANTPLQVVPFATQVQDKMLEPSIHFQTKGNKGFTLLHAYCSSFGSLGNLEVVQYLLSKGSDIKATTDDKATALHCSVASGDEALWNLLLKNKVDLDAQDVNGKTALHLAAEANNIPMVKWLIANNADLFSGDTEAAVLVLQVANLMRCNRTKGTNKSPKEQLYFAIQQMHDYALKLQSEGAKKGQVAFDVAVALKAKADAFFNPKDTVISHEKFTSEFSTLLNSKNEEMSEYRTSWSTILKNLAIALTGIGALFIAGQLIYSKASTGRALFFFQQPKTTSEEKVAFVEEAVAGLG